MNEVQQIELVHSLMFQGQIKQIKESGAGITNPVLEKGYKKLLLFSGNLAIIMDRCAMLDVWSGRFQLVLFNLLVKFVFYSLILLLFLLSSRSAALSNSSSCFEVSQSFL